MNSRTMLELGVVLSVMACALPNAHAADQSRDSISSQGMHNNLHFSLYLELHNELCGKERLQLTHQDLNVDREKDCIHIPLDEMKKNKSERQKFQDQQADILEKLLLESIISEADSTRESFH